MTKRTSRPMFGSLGRDGLKMIEYLPGDGVFGPFVTGKVYRFRPGKNPRLVDLRDLTLLTKAAGRENLRDASAPRETRPRRVKAKPLTEPETKQPAEEPVEEVNDATD